jgi:DNA modification methylase
MNELLNKVHVGDVIGVMKTFPDSFVDCIVTSPPYWALRDYEEEGQIGLEDHPRLYINKMVEVLSECKRVLKPTGTIWFNIGDSYYTKSGSGTGNNFENRHEQLDNGKGNLTRAHNEIRGKYKTNWLQSKQKLLIPYRIAIACQDELGLVIRNDINWVKQIANWKDKNSWGSSMPSSVKDRLNNNSESIFLMTKNKKYFFDLNKIRIPHNSLNDLNRRNNMNYYKKETESKYSNTYLDGNKKGRNRKEFYNSNGKNPGDCLMFPLEPSHENHFAQFPFTLPDFCIKAGCPEKVCSKCGAPIIPVYEVENNEEKKEHDGENIKYHSIEHESNNRRGFNSTRIWYPPKRKFKGYKPSCSCNEGTKKGVVLDPFMGRGTTGIVAIRNNVDYIGIDLNKDYANIAEERIKKQPKSLKEWM